MNMHGGYMKVLTILVFTFLFSKLSHSQANWIYFFSSNNGHWYYDSNSVLADDNYNKCKVWMKIVYNQPEYYESVDKFADEVLYLNTIFCKVRQYEYGDIVFYFTDNSSEISTKKFPGEGINNIIPGTAMDGLYSIICR
jgi:hypothetical protein